MNDEILMTSPFDGGQIALTGEDPSAARPISILLAEDHAVVRQALRVLLEIDKRFIVVGEATTGESAVELALALRPDVIVMDVSMPIMDGIEATKLILEANPEARVLILTAKNDFECLQRIEAVGALGYLEKEKSAEILRAAILEIAKGNEFVSTKGVQRIYRRHDVPHFHSDRLARTHPSLTPRETDVLRAVAFGLANKQTAAQLGISIKTVEKHRQQVMNKLGIHHTAGLTRYAIAAGIADRADQMRG